MRLLRRRPSSLLVVMLIALTACVGDRGRGLQQLGASMDLSRNVPELFVYECPGQTLTQVSLWLVTKDGATLVSPIWRITRSETSRSPTQVTVGETPDGFVQDVPFRGLPPINSNLAFVTRLGPEELSLQFRLPDLRKGQLLVDAAWYHNKRNVSLEEFNRENAKDCQGT